MFSSWDLVQPHFWYPMSSLEQSMMELEQMSDTMTRPRFLFGMPREVLGEPKYGEEEQDSDDDDDLFVDLPVVARKYMPAEFQLEVAPEVAPEDKKASNANSNTDTSTDMDVDDEDRTEVHHTTSQTKATNKTEGETKGVKCHNKNTKHDKLRKHLYKVAPTTERKVAPKTGAEGPTYSTYSFSNSSVVDDDGRRVTTTRRRYEDSSGRLKAVHEREIDGKKMRATWSRQSTEDEGKHKSICSSGSPEEFEALWQQTPFGEAQKETVKGQLQSESAVERDGVDGGRT
ncbi:hypothetical protein PHYPSEUDO_002838 [Phytophthora pseudosyringae]|uniref:Uncharacterized protein n=1 Tax=Phytophthora pseudosyringae TaxID=221518 RepID=A0A8T1VSB5_9STRA|nr:hypothetical protein PHYPSEUDO_002838 [Phytophthora pseudosyringae]